jgi:hypothetical protein
MTMILNEPVQCGHCKKTTEHPVLMSTNAFGYSDLDLRPPEMQRSTMNTWLQLCPGCGFCAPELSEVPADPAVLVSEPYRAALQATEFPALARRFLAYALAHESSDPAQAAQSFLQAAWACDDAGQVEQAVEARRRSATWFRRCQPFADDEAGITQWVVLVDVLRRSGQFAEAAAECQGALASPGARDMIREVLEYQQRLIAEADPGAHDLSACAPETQPESEADHATRPGGSRGARG